MHAGLFPAERRAAENALRSVPASAVTPYTIIQGKEAPNFIAVYDPVRRCFFGISAARWLEGNFWPVRHLCTDDRVFRKLGEKNDFGQRKAVYRYRLLLFGMDRFAEDHPDSGIRLLPAALYSELATLRYAVIYLEYPESAGLLKAGISEPMQEFITGRIREESYEEILQAYEADRRSGRNILQLLQDQGIPAVRWPEIIRLESRAGLDDERLRRFLDTWAGHIEPLCGIMETQGNPYTLESLLGYLERCGMYQALDAEEASCRLEEYLESCRRLGAEPDWYPAALKKSCRLIKAKSAGFNDAMRAALFRQRSVRLARSKHTYAFSQDGFGILPVCDAEEIRTIVGHRFGLRYDSRLLMGRAFAVCTEHDEAAALVFTDFFAEELSIFLSYETEEHIIFHSDIQHLPDKRMARVLQSWLNRNRVYNSRHRPRKRRRVQSYAQLKAIIEAD